MTVATPEMTKRRDISPTFVHPIERVQGTDYRAFAQRLGGSLVSGADRLLNRVLLGGLMNTVEAGVSRVFLRPLEFIADFGYRETFFPHLVGASRSSSVNIADYREELVATVATASPSRFKAVSKALVPIGESNLKEQVRGFLGRVVMRASLLVGAGRNEQELIRPGTGTSLSEPVVAGRNVPAMFRRIQLDPLVEDQVKLSEIGVLRIKLQESLIRVAGSISTFILERLRREHFPHTIGEITAARLGLTMRDIRRMRARRLEVLRPRPLMGEGVSLGFRERVLARTGITPRDWDGVRRHPAARSWHNSARVVDIDSLPTVKARALACVGITERDLARLEKQAPRTLEFKTIARQTLMTAAGIAAAAAGGVLAVGAAGLVCGALLYGSATYSPKLAHHLEDYTGVNHPVVVAYAQNRQVLGAGVMHHEFPWNRPELPALPERLAGIPFMGGPVAGGSGSLGIDLAELYLTINFGQEEADGYPRLVEFPTAISIR